MWWWGGEGHDCVWSVKSFSVLGISEQALLASYSVCHEQKRKNLSVLQEQERVAFLFDTQDMGKVPHSPAPSKQQSPDLAATELCRSHQIQKSDCSTSWSTLQYSKTRHCQGPHVEKLWRKWAMLRDSMLLLALWRITPHQQYFVLANLGPPK